MMEIFRNMWRRKFRTFLTVSGIVVGIFAFTLMGSMALKLNKMIDGGKRYITGQITIMPKGTNFAAGQMGSTLPVDTLNKIKDVEGVKAIAAGVEFPLEEPNPDEAVGVSFGLPATIEGMDTESSFENVNWKSMDMKEGHMIDKNDAPENITIGTTIALDKKWNLNDTVKLRGREFKVVGIVDKTMTGPDSYVFMNLKPARELYVESNPFLKSLKEQSEKVSDISDAELAMMPEQTRNQIKQAKAFKMEDISTAASASWNDGANSDEVANRIKEQFKDDVIVLSPQKMGEQIDKASATMNAIIVGSALLALIVGIFSIVNTMIMSVSERTKEIGVKKSLGASNLSIAWEYTLEAGVIGILGGIIGMGLGTLAAVLINNKMADQGAEIFLIDTNFMTLVVVFSFVVGIVAGILPAIRASKLKVVEALREL